MSYRRLDNIDEKIIEATLQVGSENGANKLSTKEIAKVCGISEFVIYDHFKTKENLLSITDQKICAEYGEEVARISENTTVFEEFWNQSVDFYIARPRYTAFSINYGHIFPRIIKPQDYETFLAENIAPIAKKASLHYQVNLPDDKETTYAWMWITRTIVTYAQFVLSRSLDDTPAIRNLSCSCAIAGISSLLKK